MANNHYLLKKNSFLSIIKIFLIISTLLFFFITCVTEIDQLLDISEIAIQEDSAGEETSNEFTRFIDALSYKKKTLNRALRKINVAISPFSNMTSNSSEDYIGFQITEHLTASLSSFENINIIERQKLYEVLEEQELQLSGITEENNAVRVGAILNVQHILTGSYRKSEDEITVNGRIIDIESGAILNSVTILSSPSRDLKNSVKELLFQLVTGGKMSEFSQYNITVPFVARLESIEPSETYAKALESLYKKDDAQALLFLEQFISGSNIDYFSYEEASEKYLQLSSKISGSGIYAKIITNQIKNNNALLKEINGLTTVRNTLNVVFQKIDRIISPESLSVEVLRNENIEIGSVSASVHLPYKVKIALKQEIKNEILYLIGQQEIINYNSHTDTFSVRKEFIGDILSPSDVDSGLDFVILPRIGYSLLFKDRGGNIIYRLDSKEGFCPFRIGSGQIIWHEEITELLYDESLPREGWKYRDRMVEIQAAELRNLDSIQVILNPDSFEKESSFFAGNNIIWNSLITHLYRKHYIKISKEGETFPRVKDIQIAEYIFALPGSSIKNIPLLSNNMVFPEHGDLTAVVYWADSSEVSLSGWWEGDFYSDRITITDKLTPESVLYFPASRSASMQNETNNIEGKVSFVLTDDRTQEETSVNVNLATKFLWMNGNKGKNITSNSGKIFVTDHDSSPWLFFFKKEQGYTACYNASTGALLWKNKIMGDMLNISGGVLLISCCGNLEKNSSSYTSAVDTETGMEIWRLPYGNLSSDDNYVCISEYNSKSGHNGVIQDTYLTTCFDIHTGNEIWSVDEGRAVSVFDGKAYITTLKRQFFSDQKARGYTSCYELSSGKEVWSTDSAFGYSISVETGRVYLTHDYDYHYTKVFCLDAVTGRVIWNVSFKKADPFLWKRTREFSLSSFNDDLAVLDDDSLFLIDSATGKLKWKNDIERIPIFGEDGKVYVATEDGLFCIDGENGSVIWHNSRLSSNLALEGNLLAATGPDGTYCIDMERFFLE